MVRSVTQVLVCAALLAAPMLSRADDTKAGGSGDELRQITYAGMGVSRVSADFANIHPAVNLDFFSGVRIPTVTWISAELAGSVSVIPGKNDNSTSSGGSNGNCGGLLQPACPPNSTTTGDDMQLFDIGVFAVLRSPGRLYATGRLGYRYLQSNLNELYDKRSGTQFGAGLGWRWGDSLSGVELTYNHIASNVKGWGLSIAYGFGGR